MFKRHSRRFNCPRLQHPLLTSTHVLGDLGHGRGAAELLSQLVDGRLGVEVEVVEQAARTRSRVRIVAVVPFVLMVVALIAVLLRSRLAHPASEPLPA